MSVSIGEDIQLSTDRIQFRNSSIVIYRQFERIYNSSHKFRDISGYSQEWLEMINGSTQFANKFYTGEVTKSAKKRIRAAVDLLIQITPRVELYNPVIQKYVNHKLSFITLTISENQRFISGKEAYTLLLKPFLDWLRKTKKINTYIWKAERQKPKDSNGNLKGSQGQLHYHITTPAFILYDELRKKWNYLQQQANLLEQFYKEHNHYNPNSTDIHSVYKVKDLESYLIKYISKEPYTHIKTPTGLEKLPLNSKGNPIIPKPNTFTGELVTAIEIDGKEVEISTKIDGKIWDCSSNLKGKKFFTLNINEHHERKILTQLKQNNLEELPVDQCYFIKGKPQYVRSIMTESDHENYKLYLESFNIQHDVDTNINQSKQFYEKEQSKKANSK